MTESHIYAHQMQVTKTKCTATCLRMSRLQFCRSWKILNPFLKNSYWWVFNPQVDLTAQRLFPFTMYSGRIVLHFCWVYVNHWFVKHKIYISDWPNIHRLNYVELNNNYYKINDVFSHVKLAKWIIINN